MSAQTQYLHFIQVNPPQATISTHLPAFPTGKLIEKPAADLISPELPVCFAGKVAQRQLHAKIPVRCTGKHTISPARLSAKPAI